MKLLLVSLLSVLALSCADFESQQYNGETDAAVFEKLSGTTFTHEDASKQLFINITSNKNLVKVDQYKKETDGSISNTTSFTYICSTGCITKVASDNTYRAISTNSNQTEVVITTIAKEGNKSLETNRFLLVRQQ